jgi:hypothetical protein
MLKKTRSMRLILALLLLGSVVGCSGYRGRRATVPSYVVTSAPIDVRRGLLLCVAVEPTQTTGVWWWQPGPSGCDTRITGPDVFRAEHARVVTHRGVVDARFRLQLVSGDAADVNLTIKDGAMRLNQSGAIVPTGRRTHLSVPFAFTPRTRSSCEPTLKCRDHAAIP